MAEKYCANCIHTINGVCILDAQIHDSCKQNSLMFWFPDLRSKKKIRTITETIKDSFRISELEAPVTHPKREIINEFELFLKPKYSSGKECKTCGSYQSNNYY